MKWALSVEALCVVLCELLDRDLENRSDATQQIPSEIDAYVLLMSKVPV
jgi:hypothetical protein